ncbi:MAG TPA: hypothetical protein VF137_08355, partial [Candidatus Dormibacteraeota bacterium]
VFIAAPAFASGPREGGASASAVQLRVSPLAVVPSSVVNTLASVTGISSLSQLNSLGDASAGLDVTNVAGSLGDANVYHNSNASSSPVVVNVKAVAGALGILEQELNNLGLPNVPAALLAQVQAIENTLSAQNQALAPYFQDVNSLTQDGSLQLKTASATYAYPGAAQIDKEFVVPANPAGALVVQTSALAPYTASANNGDGTANNVVEATSSLDALNVLNVPSIALPLNTQALAQVNSLIGTLESALAPVASAAGVTLPSGSSVTGTILGTLGNTINQLNGAASSIPTVTIAGQSVSTTAVTGLLQSLLNLSGALSAMPASIDLSNIVATKDVASDVTTSVTNGVVDSVATTKAAYIKVLTINAGGLTSALGVAQGNALAIITGATATAEAKADGQTSHATGSGQFTDIQLLPGSALAAALPNHGDISFQTLTSLAGCAGQGATCTVNVGPLQVVINTGVCQCVDAANGGTADAAHAAVSALEIKINYIGDPNLLLGTTAPAALTSPTGSVTNLADVQLATATADAGQHTPLGIAKTGSVYGTGLLIGFLLLVGALGIGVTYRRFAAVKAGRA